MKLTVVVWVFPIFPIASAAPVHLSDVPGGSACLAILLSVLSLLFLLLISKRIYLQARKSEHVSAPEKSDLSARSSAPSTEDNSAKAAFLVGFFGSPAWETSATNLIDRSKSVDNLHLPFGSYRSRQSKSSCTPYSSLSGRVSIGRGGHPRSPSVSIGGDVNGSWTTSDEALTSAEEKTSLALKLPSRPSLVYDASLSMTTPRRFSMPTVSRRDVNSLGSLKRASSQSANTIGHADFAVSSLVGNSSLRLVQTSINNLESQPLPLSSDQPRRCFATRYRDSSSMPSSPTTHDCILQPFPVLRSKSVTQSKNDPKSNSKDKRRISHPFALTPSSTYIAPISSTRTNQKSPTRMKMANVQPDQEPTSTLRPLSPVLLSIDLSPLSVPCSPATSNHGPASGSPFQSFREKNVVFPKIKQKQLRKSSLRLRCSPALGPSPLRAMILPDPSDPKVAVRASVSHAGSQTSSHSHDYSSLGFGFPSSSREVKEVKLSSDGFEENSEAHRATVDPEGANTLVGMIRKLVEETDRWDASLFKDKNFKAMIDDSKQALKGSLDRGHVDSSCHGNETAQWDRSTELDLSFLGLDIFQSGEEAFVSIRKDKGSSLHGDEPHPITLWEDSVILPAEKDHGALQ
ncbi:hypothetical protein C0995_014493 [Termitomyces sp. Mi166|nr:hypothetical protein C0995_014493 [Termitomyces sp. Mi166\